ncbi:hypothetical protein MTO96_013581 [Rhipicephalus appendiculatus]
MRTRKEMPTGPETQRTRDEAQLAAALAGEGLPRNETNGAALITAGSGSGLHMGSITRALAVTLFCRPASDAACLDLFSRAGENNARSTATVDVRACRAGKVRRAPESLWRGGRAASGGPQFDGRRRTSNEKCAAIGCRAAAGEIPRWNAARSGSSRKRWLGCPSCHNSSAGEITLKEQ